MALLASVSDCLNLWSFSDEELRLHISCDYPQEILHSVAWNHTNQVIAAAGVGRKVHLMHSANGRLLSTIMLSSNVAVDGDIKCITFSSSSRYLACGAGCNIHICDLKNVDSLAFYQKLDGYVTAVKFFNDVLLASGDSSGALRIWNVKESTASANLVLEHNRSSVTCVEASHSTPTKLASGYEDGSLCVWDPDSATLLRSQQLHTGRMSSLAFSTGNVRLLATGGYDGRLNLLDINSQSSGQMTASVDTCERITSISCHEDALHTAVGTTTGNILIYDWRKFRKPLSVVSAHPRAAVHALRFQSLSGSPAVSGSTKGSPSQSQSRTSRAAASDTDGRSTASESSVTVATAKSSTGQSPSLVVSVVDRVQASAAEGLVDVAAERVGRSRASVLGRSDASAAPAANTEASGTAVALHASQESYVPSSDKSSEKAGLDPQLDARLGLGVGLGVGLGKGRTTSTPSLSPVAVVAGRPDNASGSTLVRSSRSALKTSECTPPLPPPPPLSAGTTNTGRSSSAAGSVGASGPMGTGSRAGLEDSEDEDTTPLHGPFSGEAGDEFDELRRAVKPVSCQDLEDAMATLRYDLHKEVQAVVREQIRQFALAKEDTARLISSLAEQLSDVLAANAELRAENERLRRIY